MGLRFSPLARSLTQVDTHAGHARSVCTLRLYYDAARIRGYCQDVLSVNDKDDRPREEERGETETRASKLARARQAPTGYIATRTNDGDTDQGPEDSPERQAGGACRSSVWEGVSRMP